MTVKVKINISGVREYLKSQEVKSWIEEEARGVANRANALAQFHTSFNDAAYRSSIHDGKYTVIGTVSGNRLGKKGTEQDPVVAENRKHNTLLKALGGGSK